MEVRHMFIWQRFITKEGSAPEWPYPIRYEQEQEIETDILVLGGGIAGCWAAISAARKGVKVALVEKGATIRSGAGGAGCDHWENCATSPVSKVDPDERAQQLADANGGYGCGIARQILCRENYDTLLELEKMGGKVRDYDDEYKGAEGRDDETKFMVSPRYNPNHETNLVLRIWGTTFKPALKKECERLGVKIYDRVMATSLLNMGGMQGARVVGATGVNVRTGEFMVFKAKATILCTAGTGSVWVFNTELAGITPFRPRNVSGDGVAMAWRAGAELTMMEKSTLLNLGTGYKHHWYGGASDASYENLPIVDANGKRLPWPTQGWADGGAMGPTPEVLETIHQGVLKGEYALPFYGDFPSMAEVERRATWGLMIGEESTTEIIVKTFTESGFDPNKHLLQNYQLIEGRSQPQFRSVDSARGRGGILIDNWDMKTTLDGLYTAGDILPACGDHSVAASTGRYAGRKAADFALQIDEPAISQEQVALEKARVYDPIKKSDGIEWKELHAGIARMMQYFCSEYKTESLFNMGLDEIRDIEENYVPKLYALDPHKLMRSLEDLSVLTVAQIILYASLARKASSRFLDFQRIDYPELDPPEWNKFVTVRLENGNVRVGERPLDYWGNLKENYEAHNKDYTGVYQG
jgi:succinate dehydrogenase/fumarate reductase flavoprotein subunit